MDFDLAVQKLKQFQINETSRQVAHSEIAPFRDHNITSIQLLNAKKAGVLLLVHKHENEPYFTLIERSSYEGVHSKQIALPGGKVEPVDLNITATALREAQEEVNINSVNVTVIGLLSNIYVPPSNFLITPVLAVSKNRPDFIAEVKEVNEIIEVPLSQLLNTEVLKKTKISIRANGSINTPYLDLQGKIVWGATAMILNEIRHYLTETDQV